MTNDTFGGETISRVLLREMHKRNLSASRLAAKVGVSAQTANNWVNGLRKAQLEELSVLQLVKALALKGEERRAFITDLGYPNLQGWAEEPDDVEAYKQSLVVLYDGMSAQDRHLAEKIVAALNKLHYHAELSDKQRLEAQIEQADCVLVVLSPATTYGESLFEKVNLAYEITQRNYTNLIGFAQQTLQDMPQDLHNLLPRLQVVDIQTEKFIEILDEAIKEILQINTQPYELELASGAMPLSSNFYIERQADEMFQRSFQRKDPTILVKGPRQVGKTSLLVRGLQLAREADYVTVFTDFQKLNLANSENIPPEKQLENFFLALGSLLAMQLQLDTYPHEVWSSYVTANANFDIYIRQHILKKTEKHVLWVMDEVDRILPYPFRDEVFGLLRSWHSDRTVNPGDPCERLSLVLSYSTEPYLFIKDLHQSPFNIGEKIFLEDFNLEQLRDLNHRYGSPLYQGELEDFLQLLGGQPYLTRAALNEMVTQNLSFSAFLKHIEKTENTLSDHLKRLTLMLSQNSKLKTAVQQQLNKHNIEDYDNFFRLRSAGVLIGSQERPRFRCQLYENHLKSSLI